MFANRIAVVTGGGSGIGRAVARILAKESASVVVADMNISGAQETQQLIFDQNNSQTKHIALEVDVSKSDSIKELFKSVKDNYNDSVVTLLVNCAGITRDQWMIEMTEKDFDKVIDVNLKGTFLTTQLACKLMIDHKVKEGSIVNVTSVSAKIGNIGQSNYVSSKAAVEGFTRTVAREMGKFNIRCNAVMPGFIETPMISSIPEKVMEKILQQIPLNRKGQPEEVAETIAFLLSPKSSYITGSIVQVTGGMAM